MTELKISATEATQKIRSILKFYGKSFSVVTGKGQLQEDILITGSENGKFSNWEIRILDYFKIPHDNNLGIINKKVRDFQVERIEKLNEKGEKNLIPWVFK